MTVPQVVRYAAKQGIAVTPDDVREAIQLGTLTITIVTQRRILEIDADKWLSLLKHRACPNCKTPAHDACCLEADATFNTLELARRREAR
jgi:hypothetical protein